MPFGNDRAMFLVFSQNSVLFVIKRVKTLRFNDLAITRGVNVFANCVKDQFAHLVARFDVLASAFGDQNEVALGFEQRPHEINVPVEYLHASVCQNHIVKSVFSRSLKSFLMDETAVRLCCLYHFNCERLTSHRTRSFQLDEQVGGRRFCFKCQVRGIHLPGVILARFHGFSVRSEESEKTQLLAALPYLPSGPWPIVIRHRDLAPICNLIIFATVLYALLMYNFVADNFLRTPSDAPLTLLKSINSEMEST